MAETLLVWGEREISFFYSAAGFEVRLVLTFTLSVAIFVCLCVCVCVCVCDCLFKRTHLCPLPLCIHDNPV